MVISQTVKGTRPCPLCGVVWRHLVFRRDQWEVVECDCGMAYLANELNYDTQVEDHDFIDTWHHEHARRKEKHPWLLAISRVTRKLKPHIGDRLLAKALRWRKRGRLLDVGCGDGTFLEVAARHFDVVGVEISPRLAAMARQRVPAARIIEAPFLRTSLPEAHFDIVTLFSVLEHELNPLGALQAAWYTLRSNGVVVLKVPNYASWNRHIMHDDWCGFRLPDHCNYFTPRTLRAILQKVGFVRIQSSVFDRLPTSDSLYMAASKQ